MFCEIGQYNNELNFYFTGIRRPDLTEITFDFTNFNNPFSASTIQSIRINVFGTKDCSGSPQDSISTAPVGFWPYKMPSDNVKLESSSQVLGDSDPNVTLTIQVTPIFLVSKTGKGMIQLKIPYWYRVGNKNNMMFNEQDRDSCTSDDFFVESSRPSLLL